MHTPQTSPKPVTLASFALPDPVPVTLPDGTAASLRPLPAQTEQEIVAAFDSPAPPLTIKDPTKGSNAPRLPDENDPGYKKAMVAVYYQRLLGRAAVALGLVIEVPDTYDIIEDDDPDTNDDENETTPMVATGFEYAPDRAEWVRQAVGRLTPLVTRDWINSIEVAFDSMTLGHMIAGAGSGNSSTPQETAGS